MTATVRRMDVDGYMIKTTLTDGTLTVHTSNKAARVALVGVPTDGDLEIPLDTITAVKVKEPTRLVNGSLIVETNDGHSYKLHFRHKHRDGFAQLAAALPHTA